MIKINICISQKVKECPITNRICQVTRNKKVCTVLEIPIFKYQVLKQNMFNKLNELNKLNEKKFDLRTQPE